MNAVLECSSRDIAAARMFAEEIRKILTAHGRGERNNAMLRGIKVLCICVIHTIRDPHCQAKMCEVAIHSDALDKRSRWGRSSTQLSSIFLRRLILKSLEEFDDRLRSVETMRRFDRGASGTRASNPDLLVGDGSPLRRPAELSPT